MLLIFDCDGVLVDSEPIARRVLAELLEETGFPAPDETHAANHTGISLPTVLSMIENAADRPLPPGFADRLRQRSQEAFALGLRAVAGVAETLTRLCEPRCVASSGSPQKIRRNLALTGLLEYFDPHLFSGEMVARGKPAPDLFLFAAERMGFRPADCVVIEDSIPGVRAGRAAGMRVLGFVGGGHCLPDSADSLRSAGAQDVIERMADLPGWLGGLGSLSSA
ncbi:MAG TPA: HAD family hydrolase, partial [Accumulibacter sp.]|nr:HAD family hydrolase [Accumulibacter sp.]